MIRIVIVLAWAALLVACHSSVSELKKAEQISKSISNQFITDTREDLYKIRFKKEGSALVVLGETTNAEAKKALLSGLVDSKYNLVDSVRLLPDRSLGNTIWGLVNISVCNMRTSPGHDAEMATQATLGTPVRLLKKQNHWTLIQTPDRYLGWVDDDALFQTDSVGMATWRNSKKVFYLPAAGTGYDLSTKDAVTDLVAGSILKFVETIKNESVLEMPDGRRMAIPVGDGMDFDQWKMNPATSPSVLSKYAKTLMGRPYLWGGTSTKGIDCSGFVKTVYFLNGIILARDASLQFRHGAVNEPQSGYTKLKEGDLVFFGRKAEGDRPAKATHVGFYLGNGSYIHSSGFVRINSFDPEQKNFSKVRADNWLGGRTILGSEGKSGIVRVKEHPWY
jgi:hypothetical protein